jgi:neutral ceramidase
MGVISMHATLQAGVGRATITPPVGVDLMGYSRRSQPSTGIHMEMYATALVASAGDATVAILDCDLIYLHPPLVDEIRDAIAAFLGTQRSHVLINCTHSHSAPTSSPCPTCSSPPSSRPSRPCSRPGSVPGRVGSPSL